MLFVSLLVNYTSVNSYMMNLNVELKKEIMNIIDIIIKSPTCLWKKKVLEIT